MKPLRFLIHFCFCILIIALPACDEDSPTAPGDEPVRDWSWSKPRDIMPTFLFEDELGVLWVTDTDGRVLSHDSGVWTEHDTGTETVLRSIWSHAGQTWAVGNEGVIVHYDGMTWRQMQAPYPADLYRVWGTDADNVWIVGQGGTILRLVDGTWERQPLSLIDTLYAIWGRSPDDMDFGGANGTLLHFDGTSFEQQTTGTENWIFDLEGGEEGILYAAADDLLIRESGIWSVIHEHRRCRQVIHTESALYVLDYDTLCRFEDQQLTPLWFGDSIHGLVESIVPSERIAAYDWQGRVCAYEGDWFLLRQESHTRLSSIAGTAADNIFAVGSKGLVLHFDGMSWSREYSGTTRSLNGVWCSSSGDVYAVGYEVASIRSGGVWTVEDLGYDQQPVAVWGTADDDIYAVGYWGLILHREETGWVEMESPTTANLMSIWGTGPDNIYAVTGGRCGDDGKVLHFDGVAWTIKDEFADNVLWSIWGTGADNIYTVGWDGGAFYHYEGETWTIEHQPWDASAFAVHGSGPDDIYVGGYQGGFWHFDGAQWLKIEPAIRDQLSDDLWCAPDGQVFVLVDPGGILRYGP
jgi:hypothetical protein